MSKKLSKTGATNFKVNNMSWPFLIQAIENYKGLIEDTPEIQFKNKMVTKGFVLEVIKDLTKTFDVDMK